MAQFDYNAYKSFSNSSQTTQKTFEKSNVGYFNFLPNDKDTVVVRFNYDNTSKYDTVTIHKEKEDSKTFYRSVSCLRKIYPNGSKSPIDDCPLCVRGDKVSSKLYVKLVAYTSEADGTISKKPVIWERPASFEETIRGLTSIYGDLRNYLFIIQRNGAKGSMTTTYNVLMAPTAQYPQELYVRDDNDFRELDNIDLTHHSYVEKSYDDIVEFVKNGNFPSRYTKLANTEEVQQNSFVSQSTYVASAQEVTQPVTEVPTTRIPSPVTTNQFNTAPQAETTQNTSIRKYNFRRE